MLATIPLETICLLQEDDMRAVLQVFSHYRKDGEYDDSFLKEIFDRITKLPNQKVFVVKQDDIIVGAATTLFHQRITHRGGISGSVEDVAVLPKYRRTKCGSRLMTVVHDYLLDKIGCYEITVTCDPEFIRFYESLGYRVDGFRLVYRP